ncbi:MAG: hypothetical protein HYZ71_11500 [Deltaproteobacteria bacterium]|nr:hypothetical protein [Deltaproteobacteria bacterium]
MAEIAYCSIVARNYLAQSKTLAQSIRFHHPKARIFIALADTAPAEFLAEPQDFEWVLLENLGIPDLKSFCFKYTCIELSTAIKPFFLKHLFDQKGIEQVVYLDPDILVLRPLLPVEEALDLAPIVLTPHLTEPLKDVAGPTELDVLRAGVYNLGFLGLTHSESTQHFLQWWATKLYEGCQIDLDRGMHVDQRWIDLVPAYFPETEILRHPGLNIAYWNLRNRPLDQTEGKWFVGVAPAYFFHFSGFDPNQPDVISRHFHPQEIIDTPALRTLHNSYAELLKAHGYNRYITNPSGFGSFDNGEIIPRRLRLEYREMSPSERNRFGDPFDTESEGSLYQWWQAGSGPNAPYSRRYTWLENHHDLGKTDLSTHGSTIKRPLTSVKKLAARLLWPVFYRQTQFNCLSLEEMGDLRREIAQLKRQIRELNQP